MADMVIDVFMLCLRRKAGMLIINELSAFGVKKVSKFLRNNLKGVNCILMSVSSI